MSSFVTLELQNFLLSLKGELIFTREETRTILPRRKLRLTKFHPKYNRSVGQRGCQADSSRRTVPGHMIIYLRRIPSNRV